MTGQQQRIPVKVLQNFSIEIFEKLGVSSRDAKVIANVLTEANLRGIASHGVARMYRYIKGIQQSMMRINARPRIIHDTCCTRTIDADAGLGPPISYSAMKDAIAKAKKNYVGFVAVRNSNHFGIAGFYAMMALKEDMIGLCTTNTSALVVPTFGCNALLGTNPIALAVPANKERPFVLDMSTSIVTRGKLEVYRRLEKEIPASWAIDENCFPTNEPIRVLENTRLGKRGGGGLLPLGGLQEETGGHKGYGLAFAVEIFSALLSGARYSNLAYPRTKEGKALPSGIGHFFGAIRIDAFRPIEEFKQDMDDLINCLKQSKRTKNAKRIYIHGEKEFEHADLSRREGILLNPKVTEDLKNWARQLGVHSPF